MQAFVILFAERSGSTFLQTMLAGHPQVICEAEVFCANLMSDDAGRPVSLGRVSRFESRAASVAYLDVFYSKDSHSDPVRAAGFKFKYPSQVLMYDEIWDYLLALDERNRLKVVHLKRLNLLKAAISKQNQQRLWRERRRANLVTSDGYRMERLELNVATARGYMARRQAHLDEFESRLAVFGDRIDVTYEELLEDREASFSAVCTFLGVDAGFISTPATRKVTADRLEDALTNYEDVVEELSGTEFERYLSWRPTPEARLGVGGPSAGRGRQQRAGGDPE